LLRPLQQLGLSEGEIDALRSALKKNLDSIKSPEDYIMGLQRGLEIIAYGYQELVDPTPGDMIML
jgi:hypothetical protein